MEKVIMCGHTGSYNRGCEAIIRSTAKICKKILPELTMWLATFAKHDDVAMGLDHIIDNIIEYNTFDKYSIHHFKYAFFHHVTKNTYAAQKFIQKDLWRNIENKTLCLNVGGDTYCYNEKPYIAFGLNEYCKKNNIKNIFWGCSVEKNVMDKEMIDDLNKYSMILARESISYENIYNVISDKNKVKLCADPAFVLDMEAIDLPPWFEDGNTIGINLSPIVMESGKKGMAILSYDKLVRYFLNNSKTKIALIPHTYSPNNQQDLIPHRALYDKYKDSNRVIMFDEMYNCMQLKYIVSRCIMFVGARTHAVIAAYSTCVPTLAVGHSVKAKGIARDIFGSEEKMVIPVQSLKHEDDLVNAFKYIYENEGYLRKHLQDFMPSYKEKAWLAGEEVQKIIGGEIGNYIGNRPI